MNKVTTNFPMQSRNISEFKTLILEINCSLIVFLQYFPIGLWLNGTTEVLGAPQSGLFGSSLLIGWCLKGLHGTAGSVTLLPNYLLSISSHLRSFSGLCSHSCSSASLMDPSMHNLPKVTGACASQHNSMSPPHRA